MPPKIIDQNNSYCVNDFIMRNHLQIQYMHFKIPMAFFRELEKNKPKMHIGQ